MKKSNVISVTCPTFYVKRDDPTKVLYTSQDLKEWKFMQIEFIGFNPKLKKDDILYLYEKNNNEKTFRGAVLTPKHLAI
jgi:hypothetical protein